MAKTATKVETKVATKAGKSLTREEKVRAELKEVVTENEQSYVTLASLLHETYHKQYYLNWKHESFEEYCEAELDFGYRKAKHLIEIWDKVADLKLDQSRVAKLGWTKMRDLVKVLTAKNAEKMLAKAEDMSHREVQEVVKKIREKSGDPGVRASKTRLSLVMTESEAQIILEAVETGKKLAETDNVVLALEMICSEWLEYKGAVPETRSLDAQIEYLEKAYGVKLEVTSKKSKKLAEVDDEVASRARAKAAVKAAAKEAPKESAKAAPKAAAKGKTKTDDLEDGLEAPPAPGKKGKGGAAEQDIDDLLGL